MRRGRARALVCGIIVFAAMLAGLLDLRAGDPDCVTGFGVAFLAALVGLE